MIRNHTWQIGDRLMDEGWPALADSFSWIDYDMQNWARKTLVDRLYRVIQNEIRTACKSDLHDLRAWHDETGQQVSFRLNFACHNRFRKVSRPRPVIISRSPICHVWFLIVGLFLFQGIVWHWRIIEVIKVNDVNGNVIEHHNSRSQQSWQFCMLLAFCLINFSFSKSGKSPNALTRWNWFSNWQTQHIALANLSRDSSQRLERSST